ncbi:hypothetical protein LTR01_009232 [Friedmanniomyces endolithicus]|uniref:Uncharacterized protein n=1 Tax=Friedmanniomyces endolithicus TaxID=329885 RepID=A0AAN6IZ87_9PEZI|nr:hypothetical protein LTR01_009232 [Friedmanniomyces endolithicus]KAK0302930.1 hypothetical protein LTR82_017710 [Friedmanniomyces endolithicus]KAK0822614.1 hypothetical protein LTR73_009180 [Friedmanniomyces endolithicus]
MTSSTQRTGGFREEIKKSEDESKKLREEIDELGYWHHNRMMVPNAFNHTDASRKVIEEKMAAADRRQRRLCKEIKDRKAEVVAMVEAEISAARGRIRGNQDEIREIERRITIEQTGMEERENAIRGLPLPAIADLEAFSNIVPSALRK